jgi:hypothetical protein
MRTACRKEEEEGEKGLRGSGRVLEVEERGRGNRHRIGHPHGGGGAHVHVVTAVVGDGRTNVKRTRGTGRPGRTDRGRVKGVTQLTNRVDGVGVEVKGKAMQAVVSGDRRVRVPGL